MALPSLSLGRLRASQSALFVCDVQEKFRKVIHGMPHVIDTASRLVRSAEVLDLPVFVTEQYPRALGSTVPELSKLPNMTQVFEKTKFSMCTPELEGAFSDRGIGQVLLCGIEAHVWYRHTLAHTHSHTMCVSPSLTRHLPLVRVALSVYQTCLDLVERHRVEVHVCVDGVSSQREEDRGVALRRLSQIPGVYLCTSEMAIFQLVGDAKHPKFKQISAIAKEERPVERLSAL